MRERFSSRTRAYTDEFRSLQHARRALHKLLALLPDKAAIQNDPELRALAQAADDKACNNVHLIYRVQKYEGSSKDYEFSRATMEEHWRAGRRDANHSLSRPAVFRRADALHGVATFDLT